MLRDRLGWLLSGILIGVMAMASCDVAERSAVPSPSAVQAAVAPTVAPSRANELPPDANNQQPARPVGQNQFVDSYSEMVAGVFAKGNPSVVRIDVQSAQAASLGTGFVIDKEGHIITNYHVIASSGGSVIVNFIDGEAAVGDVIGVDSDADLAVIRVRDINPSLLVPAELGDSSELRVGDVVVAIGNPFGENRTTTAGIISAVRASKLEGPDQYFSIPGVLQTDAAINPGNSGGPLFNSRGQVIGVNTFILDPSGRGANIGIGYAVPINLVKRIAPALIADGVYSHPFIGLGMNELNSLAARQNSLPTKGVLISEIYQGPAANSDLRTGDIIVAVDGQAVLLPGDVASYIEFNKSPGDEVAFTVVDPSGDTREVRIEVGARPGR